MVDPYALTLATLVLTARPLADRPGRRRVLAAGVAVYDFSLRFRYKWLAPLLTNSVLWCNQHSRH